MSSEPTEIEVPDTEPPEVSSEEPDEEDFAWMEELKAHKQLHGVELVDLVKALADGQLPEALHDIVKVKLKNGDQEWESPLSKARREAMLHQDYTKKLQSFSKERDEFNSDKNEFIEMLQTWKGNPEALLAGLERLEFPVLEAAKMLAKKHRELDAMTPRERQLFEENEKLKRDQAKARWDGDRRSKEESSQKVKQEANQRDDFVSSTAKALFDKAGIPLEEQKARRGKKG